jgi:hypothetical protein
MFIKLFYFISYDIEYNIKLYLFIRTKYFNYRNKNIKTDLNDNRNNN